jgi:predicted O-methyltransferase YrrM
MKTTGLLEYFDKVGYDWNEDKENLSTICHFTKTRIDPNKEEGQMSFGAEQCFLVKAVANHTKAEKFFEIGTGRGTACYSVALEDTVEEIVTIDIVSHFQKKREAIGYKEAIVSNDDIYQMIPFSEKYKIKFKHVSEVPFFEDELEDEFDLAFIDGNHTDIEVIENDFRIANKLVRDGGVILFDDYHPTKFAVKQVVDKILAENTNFEAELVCFHGHLFEEERKVDDTGIVVVKK